MDAAVLGDRAAGGHPKAFSRPRQPLFAVLALNLQGLHVVRCRHSAHSLLFRGCRGSAGGGGAQQQCATQALRVHFLGIE